MANKVFKMKPEKFDTLCENLLAAGHLHTKFDNGIVASAVVQTNAGRITLAYDKVNYKLYVRKCRMPEV